LFFRRSRCRNYRPCSIFIYSNGKSEVTRVTGLKERTARALLSKLIENGILASDTPKGAVSMRFPINTAEILFPTLFPVA